MARTTTIGRYLIDTLHRLGVEDIFGIPGDYVINFFSLLQEGPIRTIATSTEQGAAFAADGYARSNGLGAVCVTYSVGGLNTVNAIAGAYAEKAPVVVISGAPGVHERNSEYLLHHSIRDYDSQKNIFTNVTVATTQLEDPATAIYEIDRVVEACIRHKRPVYIELPRDMVHAECEIPPARSPVAPRRNPRRLEAALAETFTMLKAAKRPVIIGGVELRRYHWEDLFLRLVERSGYLYSTSFLGKSLIDESHPQFLGVYYGALGCDTVRSHIEQADCVIMLGTVMADTNLGTARLDPEKTIYATVDEFCIKHHFYKDIAVDEYLEALIEGIGTYARPSTLEVKTARRFTPQAGAALKVSRFFERLDSFLFENCTVVSDVGDCLFGSINLRIPAHSRYYGPVYYTSMGYAVPAAIGVLLRQPEQRGIIIVGDGAFQMTGMEVSSFLSHGLNPIIMVINNHGYTTQRFLKDGKYNNLVNWNYHKLPEFLGGGLGLEVRTEDELEEALARALANTGSYTLMNLHFEQKDTSETLQRLTSLLSQRV